MRHIKFGDIEVLSDDQDTYKEMLKVIEKLIEIGDKGKDKTIKNLKKKLKKRRRKKAK